MNFSEEPDPPASVYATVILGKARVFLRAKRALQHACGCVQGGWEGQILTQLRTILTVALIALILLGAAWRVTSIGINHTHPDEIIPVAVGSRLHLSLNTDFALADLPPIFKHHSYNFSGYILATNGFLALPEFLSGTRLTNAERLAALRVISCILGLGLIALTAILARRLGSDLHAALAGAALVAVSPSLLMDSFYARPETFVSCLSLAFIIAALSPNEK